MKRNPKQTGDGTFINSITRAIRDLRQPKVAELSPVADDVRIDGKTCLVTGAHSGLGKAAAVELAKRGGNMVLACRPGHVETRGEIMRLSGSGTVEMLEVDLADLASVHRLCDLMKQRNMRIDITLMNAGLMPRRARKTPQGFEMMFAVHFLSKRVMIERWLQDGVIHPSARVLAGWGASAVVTCTPRVAPMENSLKEDLRRMGANENNVTAQPLDLCDVDSVNRFTTWYRNSQGGKLHVLINNVGITRRQVL